MELCTFGGGKYFGEVMYLGGGKYLWWRDVPLVELYTLVEFMYPRRKDVPLVDRCTFGEVYVGCIYSHARRNYRW